MRDYDPTTGRYLQADPLGLVDGASVYGYVKQSPMRLVDPTGQYAGVLACFGPQAVVCAGGAAAVLGLYLWLHWDDMCDAMWILYNEIKDGDRGDDPGASDDPPPPPPPWGGIRGVEPHPDGAAQGGSKQQGIKDGGAEQAEKEFEEATGGEWQPIGDGKLRGTGPNRENVVYNPASTGGPSKTDGGFPTIYVNGNKIRYR